MKTNKIPKLEELLAAIKENHDLTLKATFLNIARDERIEASLKRIEEKLEVIR